MSDTIPRLNAALEGRYRIERELGEGGMARVYLAEDVKHGRMVALKVLKPELAAVVGAERFLAEIETTAKLQHPHVLPLHDSGEADGLLFYVMPFVEGESLRDRLDREHQLPVDVAVRIATSLAEALDYAHRHGVIHRDIKPANVGIALAIGAGGGGRLTETGLSLGTPHYMSPEQVTGDRRVGPSSDIWALGCVLYEMLVGEPPYTGGTPQALLGRIIADEAPSASSGRRAVPGHVDGAIRRALEKLPADRFAGADDFAKALGDPGFRHGAGAAAAADASRGRTFARATAALGWIVAIAAAVALLNRPREPLDLAASINLPGGAFLPQLEITSVLDVSPDGTTVAFIAKSQAGERQLYLRRLDGFETIVVRGSTGARSVAFSPDGESVAFGVEGEVRTVAVSGGPHRTVCAAGCRMEIGTWTPADTIIYGNIYTGLSQVAASAGAGRRLTMVDLAGGEFAHVWPEALPGGGILYGVLFETGEEEIRFLSDGVSRSVLQGARQARYANGRLFYVVGSSLFSVAFDPDRGTTIGESVEIVGDLWLNGDFGKAAAFAVGGDGTLVYVPASESTSNALVRVSRDGDPTVVVAGQRQFLFPKLSPVDSTLLLFGDRGDLWTLDVASKAEPLQLTVSGVDLAPVGSPDGRVFYQSRQGGVGNLFVTSADGRDDPRRFLTSEQDQFPNTVTPDGGTLVFGEAGDIWTVRLEAGAEPTLLLGDEFTTHIGGVSPDGRWLVYVSGRSGRDEIYVDAFPDLGHRRRVSIAGGTEPVWSPAGGELFFRDGDRMMVVAYRGPTANGEFDADRARVLFERRYQHCCRGLAQYAVAADGRSLFMVRVGEAREIRVWRGWEEQAAPGSR